MTQVEIVLQRIAMGSCGCSATFAERVLADEIFRLRAEARLREHYLEVERDATELARLERDEARDMGCSKFAPQVVIVNTPPELQQQIVDAVRRVQRAEVIEIWSSE